MNRHRTARAGALLLVGVAVALIALGARSGGMRPAAAHTPAFRSGVDPDNFVSTITNPYLPYRPGTVYVYTGVKDGVTQRDLVTVTHRTKTILGVKCTVITDVATHDSTVLERTTDWYAQDRQGNVWYFGESTQAYSNGQVDTSGSWQAGVHGAQQGIVMNAQPEVGDTHRQEYWPGQAEDQYWLVDLKQAVTVPVGSYANAVLTFEWTRLEPGVIDKKYYVPGIGVVKEQAAAGPVEVANLVQFTRP